MLDSKQLEKQFNTSFENAVEYRRHFHQYPELSFEEFETSEYIAEKLASFGYDVSTKIVG